MKPVDSLTQTIAVGLFGVTQPRVSDPMRGRINAFSSDTLVDMAATAGLSPHGTIKARTAKKHAEPRSAA